MRPPFVASSGSAASSIQSTPLGRRRVLTQAAAALGLAAVGLKTFGEHTALAAVTFGETVAGTGAWGFKVLNRSTADDASAVRGEMTATTAGSRTAGVRGINLGTNENGTGVYGSHVGAGSGVRGVSVSGPGVAGMSTRGPAGAFKGAGTYGLTGETTKANGIGIHGIAINGDDAIAVQGDTVDGIGVRGLAPAGVGVMGVGRIGVLGSGEQCGVQGSNALYRTLGQLGLETDGVRGEAAMGAGVAGHARGEYAYGVYGEAQDARAIGVYAQGTGSAAAALVARGSTVEWAGLFYGNVRVTGTVDAATAQVVLDHPLDPAGQYLTHAAVASSEWLTVYAGNVRLDARGAAVVALPAWFEALNRDVRYGLTAVGVAQPNLHIAETITDNHFTIAGGVPGGTVSWQVMGVRQDAYARANPLVVEQAKPEAERGLYLHPAAHGQPADLDSDATRERLRRERIAPDMPAAAAPWPSAPCRRVCRNAVDGLRPPWSGSGPVPTTLGTAGARRAAIPTRVTPTAQLAATASGDRRWRIRRRGRPNRDAWGIFWLGREAETDAILHRPRRSSRVSSASGPPPSHAPGAVPCPGTQRARAAAILRLAAGRRRRALPA